MLLFGSTVLKDSTVFMDRDESVELNIISTTSYQPTSKYTILYEINIPLIKKNSSSELTAVPKLWKMGFNKVVFPNLKCTECIKYDLIQGWVTVLIFSRMPPYMCVYGVKYVLFRYGKAFDIFIRIIPIRKRFPKIIDEGC